jgi:spore germination protein YaaH
MPSKLGLVAALLGLAAPGFAYRITVWVPAWDANALPIMQTQAGKVDESNPGWYTLASDGSITANWGADDPSLRAAMSGTALVPTIKNYVNDQFDGALVGRVVATTASREQHAEALTRLVVEKAYDGIDIDYEVVPTTSRANFTAFVQLLGTKLHGAGKKLSLTLAAKTSVTQDWDGPGGNDWPALGAAADWIKIMAYDKHYSGSAAGAVTPLDWLQSVVAYATSAVAPNKVIVGLPWYGYDWLGTRATGVTYAQAVSLAQSNGAVISHDVNGEATFTYGSHIVFFQDASSYARKVDAIIAQQPAIGGFAHWRVGAEDPGMWDVVARVRTTGVGTINAPAAVTATATSASTVRVMWNAVTGATSYEIRRSAGGGFAVAGTSPSNSWTDTGLTPNRSWLYTVRAIGPDRVSVDSAPDVATTTIFSDDPLIVRSTSVKAAHVAELRAAVNAMRTLAGLGAYPFADGIAPGATIKASQIAELRTALSAALTTLGLPPLASANPAPFFLVGAADFADLRNGTR